MDHSWFDHHREKLGFIVDPLALLLVAPIRDYKYDLIPVDAGI